jgi:dihydroxyacetone kinase phosphotransfer subunit
MVGVLIVSHSAKVAAGALELATQMVAGTELTIAAVGGTADGAIGTDPEAIMEALRRVLTPEGVIILVDLGSAVMSAEAAVEAAGAQKQQVMIANAPLVEGAVLAALEASLGKTLPEVVAAAEAAGTMVKVEREETSHG